MRDHYEGTAYDMTQGIDAGPYNSPYRWRPMNWVVDSVEYAWERPISTQQTAFSFISQSRAYLPDDVGGLLWYGVDDTYTTCYFPLYCSISEIPHSYNVGELSRFSWESAWWVFNFVANFANLKYSYMIKDVQAVQSEIEATFLQLQPVVEKSALHLIESDRTLAIRYLTDYSVNGGERVMARWRDLAVELIRKYNDGYMQDSTGRPGEVGYPEEWLRNVLKQRSEQFRLPTKAPDAVESRLID
jgi:dipeptidase